MDDLRVRNPLNISKYPKNIWNDLNWSKHNISIVLHMSLFQRSAFNVAVQNLQEYGTNVIFRCRGGDCQQGNPKDGMGFNWTAAWFGRWSSAYSNRSALNRFYSFSRLSYRCLMVFNGFHGLSTTSAPRSEVSTCRTMNGQPAWQWDTYTSSKKPRGPHTTHAVILVWHCMTCSVSYRELVCSAVS